MRVNLKMQTLFIMGLLCTLQGSAMHAGANNPSMLFTVLSVMGSAKRIDAETSLPDDLSYEHLRRMPVTQACGDGHMTWTADVELCETHLRNVTRPSVGTPPVIEVVEKADACGCADCKLDPEFSCGGLKTYPEAWGPLAGGHVDNQHDGTDGSEIEWVKTIFLDVDPNLTVGSLDDNGNDMTQKHLGKCIVDAKNCDDDAKSEVCSGENDYLRAEMYCNDIGGDVWGPDKYPAEDGGMWDVPGHTVKYGMPFDEFKAINARPTTPHGKHGYWVGRRNDSTTDLGCKREGWSRPYGISDDELFGAVGATADGYWGCYAKLYFDETSSCKQWTTAACNDTIVSVPCMDLKNDCEDEDVLHMVNGTQDDNELHLGFMCSSPKLKHCGDGIVDQTYFNATGPCQEECDPGTPPANAIPATQTTGCTADCKRSYCGDQLVQRDNYYGDTEDCDGYDFSEDVIGLVPPYDVLTTDTANCTDFCTIETCGDGIVSCGEECDETSADCIIPGCRRASATLIGWLAVGCLNWGDQCKGPSVYKIAQKFASWFSDHLHDGVITVMGMKDYDNGPPSVCSHKFRVESKVVKSGPVATPAELAAAQVKHITALTNLTAAIQGVIDGITLNGLGNITDTDVSQQHFLDNPEHIYRFMGCTPEPDLNPPIPDPPCGNGLKDGTEECDNGGGVIACMLSSSATAPVLPPASGGSPTPFCPNEETVDTVGGNGPNSGDCTVTLAHCAKPGSCVPCDPNPCDVPLCTGEYNYTAFDGTCKVVNGHELSDCLEDCTKNVCGDGILRMDPNDLAIQRMDNLTEAWEWLQTELGYVMEKNAWTNIPILDRTNPAVTEGSVAPPTDGFLRVEQCDDGNTVDGDGCSSICLKEFCGDGLTNGGNDTDSNPLEECDDGNYENNDGCTADCKLEICGDYILQETPEDCDGCPELLHGVETGAMIAIHGAHNSTHADYGCVGCLDQNTYCLIQMRLETELTYIIDECDPRDIMTNIVTTWIEAGAEGGTAYTPTAQVPEIPIWDAAFSARIWTEKIDGVAGEDDLYQTRIYGQSYNQTKDICDQLTTQMGNGNTLTFKEVKVADDDRKIAEMTLGAAHNPTLVKYDFCEEICSGWDFVSCGTCSGTEHTFPKRSVGYYDDVANCDVKYSAGDTDKATSRTCSRWYSDAGESFEYKAGFRICNRAPHDGPPTPRGSEQYRETCTLHGEPKRCTCSEMICGASNQAMLLLNQVPRCLCRTHQKENLDIMLENIKSLLTALKHGSACGSKEEQSLKLRLIVAQAEKDKIASLLEKFGQCGGPDSKVKSITSITIQLCTICVQQEDCEGNPSGSTSCMALYTTDATPYCLSKHQYKKANADCTASYKKKYDDVDLVYDSQKGWMYVGAWEEKVDHQFRQAQSHTHQCHSSDKDICKQHCQSGTSYPCSGITGSPTEGWQLLERNGIPCKDSYEPANGWFAYCTPMPLETLACNSHAAHEYMLFTDCRDSVQVYANSRRGGNSNTLYCKYGQREKFWYNEIEEVTLLLAQHSALTEGDAALYALRQTLTDVANDLITVTCGSNCPCPDQCSWGAETSGNHTDIAQTVSDWPNLFNCTTLDAPITPVESENGKAGYWQYGTGLSGSGLSSALSDCSIPVMDCPCNSKRLSAHTQRQQRIFEMQNAIVYYLDKAITEYTILQSWYQDEALEENCQQDDTTIDAKWLSPRPTVRIQDIENYLAEVKSVRSLFEGDLEDALADAETHQAYITKCSSQSVGVGELNAQNSFKTLPGLLSLPQCTSLDCVPGGSLFCNGGSDSHLQAQYCNTYCAVSAERVISCSCQDVKTYLCLVAQDDDSTEKECGSGVSECANPMWMAFRGNDADPYDIASAVNFTQFGNDTYPDDFETTVTAHASCDGKHCVHSTSYLLRAEWAQSNATADSEALASIVESVQNISQYLVDVDDRVEVVEKAIEDLKKHIHKVNEFITKEGQFALHLESAIAAAARVQTSACPKIPNDMCIDRSVTSNVAASCAACKVSPGSVEGDICINEEFNCYKDTSGIDTTGLVFEGMHSREGCYDGVYGTAQDDDLCVFTEYDPETCQFKVDSIGTLITDKDAFDDQSANWKANSRYNTCDPRCKVIKNDIANNIIASCPWTRGNTPSFSGNLNGDSTPVTQAPAPAPGPGGAGITCTDNSECGGGDICDDITSMCIPDPYQRLLDDEGMQKVVVGNQGVFA